MKGLATCLSTIAASAGGALAGGLDWSGLPIDALFEPGGAGGSYLELSFARTNTDISGSGAGRGFDAPLAPFGIAEGTGYSDVGNATSYAGAALKARFTPKLSGALIYDQPYGADIEYGGAPDATELGGTRVHARTDSLTGLLRYQFDERWSAHGGLRYQAVEGRINLSGLSYGLTSGQVAQVQAMFGPVSIPTVNGYRVQLDRDPAWGWVLGGAFEIPEIALRVALTYSSEITHRMKTTETGLGAYGLPGRLRSTTEVKTPQSVNLDFQTGIAPDTLLFGSIRWAEWSEFRIDPKHFRATTGAALVDLSDTLTYRLGIGRRFSDEWAGSLTLGYETADDKRDSPLAPNDGYWGLSLAAARDFGDLTISGSASHIWLGDSEPVTGPPFGQRAHFSDNTAWSFGLRIGYEF